MCARIIFANRGRIRIHFCRNFGVFLSLSLFIQWIRNERNVDFMPLIHRIHTTAIHVSIVEPLELNHYIEWIGEKHKRLIDSKSFFYHNAAHACLKYSISVSPRSVSSAWNATEFNARKNACLPVLRFASRKFYFLSSRLWNTAQASTSVAASA